MRGLIKPFIAYYTIKKTVNSLLSMLCNWWSMIEIISEFLFYSVDSHTVKYILYDNTHLFYFVLYWHT